MWDGGLSELFCCKGPGSGIAVGTESWGLAFGIMWDMPAAMSAFRQKGWVSSSCRKSQEERKRRGPWRRWP